MLNHCPEDFCLGLKLVAKKKTTHFVLNPPCWGRFHPVGIKIAKMRFGTQGAHFPVNWMEFLFS